MVEVSGTTLYHNAIARIRQLEKQCEVLTAEVDRMRPVVTAAVGYRDCDQYGWDKAEARRVLIQSLATYESSKPK